MFLDGQNAGKKNRHQKFFSLLLSGHCVDSIKQIKKKSVIYTLKESMKLNWNFRRGGEVQSFCGWR